MESRQQHGAVPFGPVASPFIVVGLDPSNGNLRAVVTNAAASGIEAEFGARHLGLDAVGLSTMTFDHVVEEDQLIGGLAQASIEIATDELTECRLGFSAQRWATSQCELELMNATVERGRRLNDRSQAMYHHGQRNRLESSIAKALGPRAAERIIRRCMQLLGPDGISTDLLLEKWYRDVKIPDIFEGTGQVMRLIISRERMGRDKAD